jgi:tetratricopeptide (TPR) repeat protein
MSQSSARQNPKTAETAQLNPNLLEVLQQEIDIGGDALKRGQPDVAVTFFQSALSKMDAQMPFYDHIVHNLLNAYKSLIESLLLRDGNDENIRGFLNAALNLDIKGEMADDKAFRRRFADVFQNIGLVFFENARMDESIACCRRAIAFEPSSTYYVNLNNVLAITGKPAILSDFTTRIAPENLGRHLFIACVPKSASTFLKNMLLNLTGYRDLFSVYAAGQNEHDLYLPALDELADVDTVTQQHCRASDANVKLMQAFGIRPVVLVRNIFDSVMSLLDFYNNQGAYLNSYFKADFTALDEETQIDLLIENIIPWYFQFVASWSNVGKENRIEIKWLSFEELTQNKTETVLDVLKFYGLGAANRNIEAAIKHLESQERKIRFNKGVSGRGKIGVSERQKERIKRMARFYPSTDFSRIGL